MLANDKVAQMVDFRTILIRGATWMKQYLRDLDQIENGTLQLDSLQDEQVKEYAQQVKEQRAQLENELNFYVTRAYTVYDHEVLTEAERLQHIAHIVDQLKDWLHIQSRLNLLRRITASGKLELIQQTAATYESALLDKELNIYNPIISSEANGSTNSANIESDANANSTGSTENTANMQRTVSTKNLANANSTTNTSTTGMESMPNTESDACTKNIPSTKSNENEKCIVDTESDVYTKNTSQTKKKVNSGSTTSVTDHGDQSSGHSHGASVQNPNKVKSPPTDRQRKDEQTYVFDRKLRGGFVSGLDYYLPESLVKQYGFEHGDLLYIDDEHTNFKGETKYEFSLAEKKAKPHARIELHKCILKRENSFLVTDTYFCMQDSQEKLIWLEEIPYTFVIAESEALDWKVEQGDIIDIAYYENDPTKVKIIYKHHTESNYTQPQKSSTYKDTTKADDDDTDTLDPLEETEMESLHGQTIAVVGSDYRFPDYAEACEKIGVNFIGIAGNAYKAVPGLIRDITEADIVVLMIHAMRHQTSATVVQTCKEQGKPFAESRSFGIKSMFRAALTALDKPTSNE